MPLPLPLAHEKAFWEPSAEVLSVLNGRQWVCSYSGGKDSTSLVTWIEWLRRCGVVKVDRPSLVQSDTGVEYPFLAEMSNELMRLLRASGWSCETVQPKRKDKLYNQIFGRGVVPIHPGITSMRWCTRATKLDPMRRFTSESGDVVMLSGVRWGESDRRDSRLLASGCRAGGECGLPAPSGSVSSPIITWKTCNVLDWLNGWAADAADIIPDLISVCVKLLSVYNVQSFTGLFGPPKVTALRFGCIGCPAVGKDKVIEAHVANNPAWKNLRRLYGLWEECYRTRNRIGKVNKHGKFVWGPLRINFRKKVFAKLLAIQSAAGVVLVDDKDREYIEKCWDRGRYPRGWSAADELNVP